MTDIQWKEFFLISARILGGGESLSAKSRSWCAWTTYRRLTEDAGYWTSGLPHEDEVGNRSIGDGGTWGQPFFFLEIAHIIIPATFFWEEANAENFNSGNRTQDLITLSQALSDVGIEHRKTELILEIKRY